MKVITKSYTMDYRDFFKIIIVGNNGRQVFTFVDGEPEDACLGRDFNRIYEITDMLKTAYENGTMRNGFSSTHIDCETFEEWDR